MQTGHQPLIRALLIHLCQMPIRIYRLVVSPLMPPCCRFVPSCSEYGLMAIADHGPFRGGWLTLKRICRCHPFGGSGLDPVPPPPHIPAASARQQEY